MKLPIICRTCDARDSDNLYKLTTPTKKYPEKMLSDLLTELTEIDLNGSYAQELPQSLCSSCTMKLISAYYFVRQVRDANEVLMNHLESSHLNSHPTCLQELPMELCAEQHVEVKMETKDDEVNGDITCTELPELALFQQAETVDIVDEIEADSAKPIDDLLISPDVLKQEQDTDTSSVGLDVTDIPSQDCENDDSLDDLPLKQLARKWKLKKKPGAKKKYNCYECSESFTNANFLKQHYSRTHKTRSTLNEQQKAKTINLNLCRPHGYKCIECMICQNKFGKISELRRHFEEHAATIDSEEQLNLKFNELAELLYPDSNNLTEEHLKSLIRKELSAGAYDQFYSITNEFGYEMNLDSSETESEDELGAELETKQESKRESKYTCELCQLRYPRKYQLYEHQRLSHSWSEAPHVCSRCDARFVSLELLKHHNETQCKNSQKRFLCRKCPMRFRWRHNRLAHSRDHHTADQTFECNKCKQVFDKKRSLSVHLRTIHDNKPVIPCQWCNRTFFRNDYLVKHLKRHGINEQDIPLAETLIAATTKPNGLKNITCKVCNLQFQRIADLRGHMQLELKLALSQHQNYESLENYSITNYSGFELHLDDSETEDECTAMPYKSQSLYICELCQVQGRRKYEIMQHQHCMHRFDTMPYNCDRCIFKSVSKNIMDHHKRVQCLSEQKKHVCRKCSFKFMWPENLEKHMQIQHAGCEQETLENIAQKADSEMKSESSEIGVQLLQCPHCDRTYKLMKRLNYHIRDVHTNQKRKAMKNYLCSLCGRGTQSAASLATHMRRHTGEKPFKCDLCEMAFHNNSEMVYHRRKHTGEKPYHCSICGKNFARSDKLKRHQIIHGSAKRLK